MDESVQVLQNIRMQIVYNIDREHSCGLFDIFHMRKVLALE